MKSTKVIILGATGSIGRQTIECIEAANHKFPGRFEVVGLSANRNQAGLRIAAARFSGAKLALDDNIVGNCSEDIAYSGAGASSALLENMDADLVVNGIAGAAGLVASLAALSSKKNLALANKESVVMGYSHLKALAQKNSLYIIPVDSEHAALFQLVSRLGSASITELSITASGGPFRTRDAEELKAICPDEAAHHPVWKMGRKISIDSATLANKGLELIEAVRLFGLPEDKVKVLIHPESIVHALVRTKDGALYAHISSPDMRLPIDIALHWPEEVESAYGTLDLAGTTLHFEAPDTIRFPMLALARLAVRVGEAATIAYNAANEIAVECFEEGKISFTQIGDIVDKVLEKDWAFPVPDTGSIFDIDAKARSYAQRAVAECQC
ncbi:MAG: 1-deoxy-D-xylulose-5-phosphate reductoisomerase [Spirochaetae bacterium HGW-Spirochaetae-9]|nr:MAG: 1-deoxy-D-xylulose-5-phosphate reductoisomerase [Spirochaetae bacterium HGW-Spirochaetae-9]